MMGKMQSGVGSLTATKVMKRSVMALMATVLVLPSVRPVSAQISDPRVIQLEEEMRRLNGQVEELNFQMLQMQDQIRRMQEDNEFRLQQLENNQQGALTAPDTGTDLAATASPEPKDSRVETPANRIENEVARGAPPRNLGALKVDENGQVLGAELDFSKPVVDTAPTASVTLTGTPDEIYSAGYSHILNGDYGLAEAVFGSFVATYPNDPLTPDALFWLGESKLAQGRFEDAADVFINVRSNYPNADKAPETMLKIGTIMAGLGNRDVACATFANALETYGSMAVNTRNAIVTERQNARC